MSFELHRAGHQQALKAASAMPPRTVVALDTVQNQIVPVASVNLRPFGVVGASGASPGMALTVYEDDNVVKCIAAASLGYGTEVGVASIGVSSQAQGNTSLATTTLLGPVAGASGSVKWAVGLSEEPALAGEVFSVRISTRQLSGEP